MNNNIIKEFFKIKYTSRGAIFELLVYPFLKEYFGYLAEGSPLDFVNSKNIYIEVKYRFLAFSDSQLEFIMRNLGNYEFYVVTTDIENLRKFALLEKHFETFLGTAYLLKIDKDKFKEHYLSYYNWLEESHDRYKKYKPV